jgi:Carbohydrate family 9 binding domain-like
LTCSAIKSLLGITLLTAGIPVLIWGYSRGASGSAMMTTKPHSAGSPRNAANEMRPYTSKLRIVSRFSPEDFTPDGNLEKKVWQHAGWVRFDHAASGRERYPQSAMEVATVWTPTNVYFAYRCKYQSLNLFEGENPAIEKVGLWDRDVVEVFLNPTPEHVNHYYEFEVAPNNMWVDLEITTSKKPVHDTGWNSHYAHAAHADPVHHIWTCEMRIPVASMRVKSISAGSEWRLNLFRADGPGSGNQRRFLAWSTIPNGTTFHVPSRFGILHFAE